MSGEPTFPGKLIAIEGIDGAGKSTQVHLLQRWLEARGCRVSRITSESSGLVREATRRGKKQRLFTPTTYSLICATDFADGYERQILPMLKAGYLVLCDRYIFSSLARDAVRGCEPDWLRALYGFAHRPEITFLLELPLHTALDRVLAARKPLGYFDAGMDLGLSNDLEESYRLFQGRLADQFLQLAREFHFRVIDATQSIHHEQALLRGMVEETIDLARHVRSAPS